MTESLDYIKSFKLNEKMNEKMVYYGHRPA